VYHSRFLYASFIKHTKITDFPVKPILTFKTWRNKYSRQSLEYLFSFTGKGESIYNERGRY